MRLIDADLFKENIMSGLYIFCQENKEDICRAIDDEPTIERPQGKWIITKDEKFYRYKCPVCGRCDTGDFLKTDGNIDLPNFCEKCGADLRGKKND